MNARFRDRFFVWAIALSLAVHATFALVLHRIPPAQAEPERPTRVEIVRVATPPPPTPTPRPVVQPRHPASRNPARSQPHHVAVALPRVATHGSNPDAHATSNATPGPEQTGSPAASSPPGTPAPACSQPYVAARTIDAVAPSTPDDAAGLQGTAEIQVSLDAAGRVTDVRVYRSTGSMSLDRAAMNAARRSTYAPQIVDCQPAGGTYLFRVDFQS
ncbi:MAG: TonB family protein [Candidatus Eremiobacteraeota bacterium]|nr:TonB family protein [Candidatus Eremiobacteraeota bacterium]MBV8722238.1 TonB family protein [Candidatus Eremiobacteraeota bacterium]